MIFEDSVRQDERGENFSPYSSSQLLLSAWGRPMTAQVWALGHPFKDTDDPWTLMILMIRPYSANFYYCTIKLMQHQTGWQRFSSPHQERWGVWMLTLYTVCTVLIQQILQIYWLIPPINSAFLKNYKGCISWISHGMIKSWKFAYFLRLRITPPSQPVKDIMTVNTYDSRGCDELHIWFRGPLYKRFSGPTCLLSARSFNHH
jgi:hypothetical protein